MELWLIWIVAGFALVIAELVTGTFYLLVIGMGAFTGALAAWLGGNILVQAVAGSAVAVVGAFLVHHWHASHRKDEGQGNMLDKGQPVVVDVRIDYSKRTRFTQGVVKTVLKRFPLGDKFRFVGRAIYRKITG